MSPPFYFGRIAEPVNDLKEYLDIVTFSYDRDVFRVFQIVLILLSIRCIEMCIELRLVLI